MKIIDSFRSWYRGLPDKKRYVEVLTAFLTIPVLITVIINNLSVIKSSQNKPTPTPTQASTGSSTPIIIIKEGQFPNELNTITPAPTAQPGQCQKSVGPVEISYPAEDEQVIKNPVCIDISYNQQNFCSVVWSYRINNSAWSDYSDKSLCLYNLDPGLKNLELRVKSIASNDEVILKRSFTVLQIAPVSPTSTPSAGLE